MRNKELTHARLKDSEQKRVRLIATMEEAAKRKERSKPKEITQADRLAEAARTERLNSKSLNRWEEMEKKKSEEQKAKLEALHNRRLEGPVISWWSGVAKWINGRLAQVGIKEIPQENETEAARKKKGRDATHQDSLKRGKSRKSEKAGELADTIVTESGVLPDADPQLAVTEKQTTGEPSQEAANKVAFAPPQEPGNLLDGIHFYASLPEETLPVAAISPPQTPATATQPTAPATQAEASVIPATTPAHTGSVQIHNDLQNELMQLQTDSPLLPKAPPPPGPPTIEHSSRNLVVLENFDAKTSQEYSVFFNTRKPPKLQSKFPATCLNAQIPPVGFPPAISSLA
jgi:vacuolar protein sorting-associated protein 72